MSTLKYDSKPSKSFVSFLRYPVFLFLICFLLLFLFNNVVYSQAEVEPWGNITGMRIGGQLIPFETNLSLVENNLVKSTAQEQQRPKYLRDGNKQIITTKIDSVSFTETIEDIKEGIINVDVAVSSNMAIKKDDIFFVVALPLAEYTQAIGISNSSTPRKYVTAELKGNNKDFSFKADSISFISKGRKLQFVFDKPTEIVFKKNSDTAIKTVKAYIHLLNDDLQKDSTAENKFIIKAGGNIDNRSITFKLNTSKEGKPFDGFGGNFRLQNPKADPQVIDYCLQNLRVAWGRVEFP